MSACHSVYLFPRLPGPSIPNFAVEAIISRLLPDTSCLQLFIEGRTVEIKISNDSYSDDQEAKSIGASDLKSGKSQCGSI